MQNKILNFFSLVKGLCFSICLFVCPLLFLTDATQNPFTVQPLFFSIFGGVFILCCALEICIKKEISLRYSKIDFALIAFLFFLLCSLIFNCIFGTYKAALINEFLRKADYLFFGIFGFIFAKIMTVKYKFSVSSYNFLKNVFIWCLLWSLYKLQSSAFIVILLFGIGIYFCYLHLKNYGIKEVFDVLLAVCFCACLYGLMQTLGFELFWVLDVSKEFGVRPVSTFGNPNFLASFTLLFLPYALILFVKSKSKKEILISGFIALILALFLFISGTRSAWIGFIGASFLFVIFLSGCVKFLFKSSLKLFILFLVFCACAFGLTVSLKYNNASAPKARISEVKQVLNLKDISLKDKIFIQPLHQRLMMWYCAFNGFKKAPILGNGVNSFQLNFPFCQGKLITENPALDKMKMQANAVHNEYLEILYEGGLLTFLSYLILWVLFFTLIIKKIKSLDNENKIFYFALTFGLTSVLMDNLFNITLRTSLTGFAFWFAFSTVNNLVSQSKKIKLKNTFSVSGFIVIIVLIFSLIWFETKQFISQNYELKGYKNLIAKNNQDTIKNMEMAIDFSSLRPEPYYTLLTTFIDVGNLEKAEDITKKVLKFYPAYYEFYFRLAALQNAKNNNLESLQNLRTNLSLLPTYTPAAELFANILVHQESVTNEDKQLLGKLIEILPYNTNLPSYLAEIYFKENNCRDSKIFALKTLEKNIFDKISFKILQACRSDNEALLHRAETLISLKEQVKKQNFKVLVKLEKMLKDRPDDQDLQMLLAEVYFRKGDFCKSRDILKHTDGNGKFYNFALSLAAQKCGDLLTSQKALADILFLDNYDELAKIRLKNVNI